MIWSSPRLELDDRLKGFVHEIGHAKGWPNSGPRVGGHGKDFYDEFEKALKDLGLPAHPGRDLHRDSPPSPKAPQSPEIPGPPSVSPVPEVEDIVPPNTNVPQPSLPEAPGPQGNLPEAPKPHTVNWPGWTGWGPHSGGSGNGGYLWNGVYLGNRGNGSGNGGYSGSDGNGGENGSGWGGRRWQHRRRRRRVFGLLLHKESYRNRSVSGSANMACKVSGERHLSVKLCALFCAELRV